MRSAQKNGQRPTAMILHDPYAMHRHWWDWGWTPGPNDTDWTVEDFILADVYQVIEDYTNPNNGAWRPYDESGDVYWNVKSTFSGYDEAIDKERERRKDLKPGESLYAVPEFADPDNKPTLETWIKDMDEGNDNRVPTNLKGARPPTPEELAAMGL